jgi:hypothetical protein
MPVSPSLPAQGSSARLLVQAEAKFAELIQTFLADYPVSVKPALQRIILLWIKSWFAFIDPQCYPPHDAAWLEIEKEIYRLHVRRYQLANRERLNTKARRNHYRRKKKADPNYVPRYKKKPEYRQRKFP